MMLLDWLLTIVAVALAVPALFLLIECVLALPRSSRDEMTRTAKHPRTFVVIPAHNEALGIAPVVTGIRGQLAESDRLIVVADNCTDDTAAVARAAGAEVIERHNLRNRGKGFAIEYAVNEISKGELPDVVVLIDADCFVSAGDIGTLARLAHTHKRPVQAEYLLEAPSEPTPKTVVSALAILVNNRVRPRGLRRLCGACQLTGSGMAFPWPILKETPALGADLVEDLRMGIELALLGVPALGTSAVQITSDLPSGDKAAQTQRRRWEHGHLSTILSQGPRLLGRGLTSNPRLIALALDLIIPPLALLVLALGAASTALSVYWLAGGSILPFEISVAAAASVFSAVMLAWLGFARGTLPLRYLTAIPGYVLWKLPLYFALARGGRHGEWERTQRDAERAKARPTSPRPGTVRAESHSSTS